MFYSGGRGERGGDMVPNYVFFNHVCAEWNAGQGGGEVGVRFACLTGIFVFRE